MSRELKSYGGVDYILSDDLDYSIAMKEAESVGDYEYAASLERSRNAKIDGEGLPYAKTYKYNSSDGSSNSYGVSSQGSSSGALSSRYGSAIGSTLNKILNREKFDYDYTKDDSYKALEAAYKANGKLAMQDTLGDAAALTGGRASSAAVSASQQAYNNYMQQLSENIPALEQAAYSRYVDEGNDLYNQISLLQGLENTDYSRYRDDVSDNQWQQTFDYTKEQDAIDNNYRKERDKIADDRHADETAYERKQDAKQEALGIAGITGDYSGLIKYDYSQETVDALNAAHAEGVAKEEIALALQRAQIAAQYGNFSDFISAGFSEETVAQMKAFWDKGQITEDALVAAQFGDYSKLSELGITPGGGGIDIDEVYYSYIADYETGGMPYQKLVDFADDFISVIGNEKYVELLTEIQTREEKKNKVKSEEVYYDYAAFVQSGKLTYNDLTAGRNADNINKILGDEYYIKLCEYAKGIEDDYSNL